MSKHTPGPWIAEDRTDTGSGFSIISPHVHYSRAGVAHYISAADASLIAAAPSLLDALKTAREQLVTLGGEPSDDPFGDRIQSAILVVIDTAIARAEGSHA